MNVAVIAVGSNINPQENIKSTKDILSKKHALLEESTFVTTTPIGFAEQDDFVNGALLISTDLTLEKLKTYLKEVENTLGRVKTSNKYGPRTIDLDVIVWNGKIIDNDFYNREFVKNAVLELLPNISPHSHQNI